MGRGKAKPAESLIFIDTNIYLDFYRQSRDAADEALERIDTNRDKIICSFQLEAEFKKNRQRVISESVKNLKSPDWGSLAPPAILADSGPASVIDNLKGEITVRQNRLKKRLTDLLDNPSQKDPVYQVLQRLFKNDCDLNLRETPENSDLIEEIVNAAAARFNRGLPPRKSNDTSYGDAINWEWMVRCAERAHANLVIVSRDQDYGLKFSDTVFVNDWLQAEFKSRLSQQRKIMLTDRLSEAFKQLNIAVSAKTVSEEKRIVEERESANIIKDGLG